MNINERMQQLSGIALQESLTSLLRKGLHASDRDKKTVIKALDKELYWHPEAKKFSSSEVSLESISGTDIEAWVALEGSEDGNHYMGVDATGKLFYSTDKDKWESISDDKEFWNKIRAGIDIDDVYDAIKLIRSDIESSNFLYIKDLVEYLNKHGHKTDYTDVSRAFDSLVKNGYNVRYNSKYGIELFSHV